MLHDRYSIMYKMDAHSTIVFYSVLLLCYNFAQSINTDSRYQNLSQSQNVNVALSKAERVRRLVPYITYYVVGNNDDDVNYQYQNQNANPNLNTPRPQTNNFYNQNERKPQQKPPHQNQHTFQITNQRPQQHTTPAYLRFPSSPKIRRPIVVPTTEIPYTIQTEKTYNYYYDYIQTSPRPIVQTSPRPIVQTSPRPIIQTSPRPILQPNPIKYDHGFLPTIPTIPPTHYSTLRQEIFSTKSKKLRRPKPKRPTTPTATTTTDKYGALNDLLHDYDLGNRLSNKITAENIGSSIQTLSAVLQILQNEADEQVRPMKHKPVVYRPDPIDEYDSSYEGNQGRPGVDYPLLSVIPKTNFDCKTQRYKGFFGDPETHCQVWHYCDLNGGQASFLCPNGTIFNQVSLTCDWWFNVKCDTTAQLYVLNERLYKYIIPSKPSFPEDYEGPLVDKYLEDKFKETEHKKSQQREPMPQIMNITTVEPDTVRTPYQQLLDVDT